METNPVKAIKKFDPEKDLDLMVLFDRAKRTLTRMQELELAQHGVTIEQTAIMHTIFVAGGSATAKEIANTIVRQYHSVVSIVNRMEKLGLVKREKLDGSNTYTILLTEEGMQKFSSLPRKSISMFFEDLSLQEKRQFGAILEKILIKGRNLLGLDAQLPFLSESSDTSSSEKRKKSSSQ